jgi:hypothetical protein
LSVMSCLSSMEAFQGHDFKKGLPPIVKPIVGSDQTRKASKVRRTDTTTFLCPIPRCGSTVTKKHNLISNSPIFLAQRISLICLS